MAQQAIVYSINRFASNAFGQAVSISGDIAIVSEKDYANLTGQACIFERTGTVWNRTVTLNASFMQTNDQFGFSVSISGDYVAVGCPGDKVLTFEGVLGSVYIFKKNGSDWSLIRKIEDPDGLVSGGLGTAVAIDGTAFNVIGGLPNNFVSDPKKKGKVLFLNVE